MIDTNVLVHDPASIKKFKDNDVVISLSVLEELDSLKRHADEVGKNAREVIRYIDSLKAEESGDLHHWSRDPGRAQSPHLSGSKIERSGRISSSSRSQ